MSNTSPYTLSDSGIHGPGLGSAPISLAQLRAEPDTMLLCLNQAYRSGGIDMCRAAQPTIDAYKSVAESATSRLEVLLSNAERRMDAKALDRLAEDAGLPTGSPDPLVRLGPGGEFVSDYPAHKYGDRA